MNLRPQAICKPFCRSLTVAALSASLPAEEEAPGYAENRIRYSNKCARSPTSSCVFFFFPGQSSPVFSTGKPASQQQQIVRARVCVCVHLSTCKPWRITTDA